MNLPDKIKPTFRRITDKVIIAADLSLEAKTINQLIDYLKDKESEQKMTTNTQIEELRKKIIFILTADGYYDNLGTETENLLDLFTHQLELAKRELESKYVKRSELTEMYQIGFRKGVNACKTAIKKVSSHTKQKEELLKCQTN